MLLDSFPVHMVHGLGTKLTLHVNNNFELCVNHAFWENIGKNKNRLQILQE